MHPVESRKDYFFGDPLIDLPKEAKDVIDAKLDAEGHLSEEVSVLDEARQAPVAAVPARLSLLGPKRPSRGSSGGL